MYMSGNLNLNPKQVSHIEKVKPTKAFKKMLYILTAGGISDQMEHQTFTAISILQQLNNCFRKLGITNIVRLAKDDIDFYLDDEGRTDDLKDALDHFNLEVDKLESEVFKTLHLVLEHEADGMKYLIQIDINRSHEVGAYPIVIEVNGLSEAFKANDGQADSARKNMEQLFSNQEQYDRFVLDMKNKFNTFLGELEIALRTYIRVDEIQKKSEPVMIRPKSKIDNVRDIHHGNMGNAPVFQGYHGFDGVLLYTFLWAGMCHSNAIHCHNFTMVDDLGNHLMDVGESGFTGGETDMLNSDVPFEESKRDAGAFETGAGDGGDSGGWFDSGGDSGGSDGGSSCSSCSSCGGCGGCS